MLIRLVLALLVLVAGQPALVRPATAETVPYCATGQSPVFRLGFAELHTALGDRMGQPLECEHADSTNGEVLQQTSTGLAVYHPATNTPSFTNGYSHWALTPDGLVTWDGIGADTPPATAPAQARPADVQATPQHSGWATVLRVEGPETLVVTNASGERLRVWSAGIIGPSREQGDWRDRATQVHDSLVPPGTRVWLEREPALSDAQPLLRHVFLPDRVEEPVAADLLRSGSVWVYPHGSHAFRELYADLQARAVLDRVGPWAETRSTAVFLPRGSAHGGLPIDPAVSPALAALDATVVGHAVLAEVNLFPVEVGVSRQADTVIGAFMPRYYSVQLSPDIMRAPPQAIAGVLVHELVHVQQMVARVVENRRLSCYEAESEAFQASATYWDGLYGSRGKQPALDPLEVELNHVLAQFKAGQLDTRVHRDYESVCEAA